MVDDVRELDLPSEVIDLLIEDWGIERLHPPQAEAMPIALSGQNLLLAIPTASGKTSLSIKLAKKFNCGIISADSRQFYKEMSIGTTKPTSFELEEAPHFFINNLSFIDFKARPERCATGAQPGILLSIIVAQ